MHTLYHVYKDAKNRLKAAGINNPDLAARRLVKEVLGFSDADFITLSDYEVPQAQCEVIESLVERCLAGEPVSRILGEREFWGLTFDLSPDTLDPRPDTEVLVERALEAFTDHPPETILDLGTGTGCVLIALLSEWPDSFGIGVDLSQGAVRTAQSNAKRNHVEAQARFICGSWADSIEGQFDLIVSNPPYIANQIIPTLSPEVKNHDPILALDGGENGLQAYSEIFSVLKRLLRKGGKALFEIGFDQRVEVMRLAENSGLFVTGLYADYAGQPRVVEICCGDK